MPLPRVCNTEATMQTTIPTLALVSWAVALASSPGQTLSTVQTWTDRQATNWVQRFYRVRIDPDPAP